MNTGIHRALSMTYVGRVALERAEKVHAWLQKDSPRQVRLHHGRLLTFPMPAPRGYGVRGMLVGVYTREARLEWIAEDLSLAMAEES